MLNHYETLKAQKTGRYPDFYTALRAGKRSGGSSGEVEGVPPLTVRSSGVPIAEWQIWGNTVGGAGVGDIGKNIFSIFADHVLYNTNYFHKTVKNFLSPNSKETFVYGSYFKLFCTLKSNT